MTIQSVTVTTKKTVANDAGKIVSQIPITRIINVIINIPAPTTRHSFFVLYLLFSSLLAVL